MSLLRPMALPDSWAGPVSLLWRPGFWCGAVAFAVFALLLARLRQLARVLLREAGF